MTPFTDTILDALGPTLQPGEEVIALMRWLEGDQQNLMRYTSTNVPFLPTTPVSDVHAVWSNVAFVHDPEYFKYWLGREDLSDQIAILARCGGDGSHMGIWRDPNAGLKYVFCGSEGDAFTVADNGLDFAKFLVMGYFGIEGMDMMTQTPEGIHTKWYEEPWPDNAAAKEWLRETYNAQTPRTAADLIPEGTDAFPAWIEANSG